MSLIDDKYIDESMTEYKPKMPAWAKRSLATAAMLVLVVAVSLAWLWASGSFMPKNDMFAPGMWGDVNCPGEPSPTPPAEGGPNYGSTGDGNAFSTLSFGDTVSTESVRFTVSAADRLGIELTVSDYDYTDIGFILVYYNAAGEACAAAYGMKNTSQFKDTTELLELFTHIEGGSGTLRLSMPEGEVSDIGSVTAYVFVEDRRYRIDVSQ